MRYLNRLENFNENFDNLRKSTEFHDDHLSVITFEKKFQPTNGESNRMLRYWKLRNRAFIYKVYTLLISYKNNFPVEILNTSAEERTQAVQLITTSEYVPIRKINLETFN